MFIEILGSVRGASFRWAGPARGPQARGATLPIFDYPSSIVYVVRDTKVVGVTSSDSGRTETEPRLGRCLHVVEDPPPFGGEAEAGDPLLEKRMIDRGG